MRKHILTEEHVEENTAKKQKIGNGASAAFLHDKYIYSFKKDNFGEFTTPTTFIEALCLHPTKDIIALFFRKKYFGIISCIIMVYTLEGDLVTHCTLPGLTSTMVSQNIYLSDYVLVTTHLHNQITRCNDYNVKNVHLFGNNCRFDCDKNDNIYLYSSLYGISPEHPQINIYTQDFEYIGEFSVSKRLCHQLLAFRIQGDAMVILNSDIYSSHSVNKLFHSSYSRNDGNFTILRFSLSNKQLLQTVEFNKYFFPYESRISLLFDCLGNVLIGSLASKEFAVWYLGNRGIRYYRSNDHSIQENSKLGWLVAVSRNFQMIQACGYGYIRVFEPNTCF
ncbi:hypothetical protein LOD99_11749 [Oopsacas minuta]|uniref:Uncharacterized protein n=1 Tax=Oopsacas minuta TaxID=111878 RepID=A0AAV7JKP2_9METZ|nr:hypothetical protein LOD99_11749 [Oopsacas minuta]